MLIYIQSVLLLKPWPKGEIWRQTILQMQLDLNDNFLPIEMIIKQARNHKILENGQEYTINLINWQDPGIIQFSKRALPPENVIKV